MIELGYFALGFASGIVFTFASLLSVGRWLNRASGLPSPPTREVQDEVKKQQRNTRTGMWD